MYLVSVYPTNRTKYQEIGLLGWFYLQRGFQDTIMIHENDIGRVDLSPDYLTLCNRYFIRETSLPTAILGETFFGVASDSFIHNDISSVVEFQRWWILKSKIFAQESTCSKEILIPTT